MPIQREMLAPIRGAANNVSEGHVSVRHPPAGRVRRVSGWGGRIALKAGVKLVLAATLPARFTRDPPRGRVSFVGRVRLLVLARAESPLRPKPNSAALPNVLGNPRPSHSLLVPSPVELAFSTFQRRDDHRTYQARARHTSGFAP